jgi:hypothetical protein
VNVDNQQLWHAEPTIRRIFTALDAQLAEEFDLNAIAGEAKVGLRYEAW